MSRPADPAAVARDASKTLVGTAIRQEEHGLAEHYLAEATVFATLAVAEEQRTANLIAYLAATQTAAGHLAQVPTGRMSDEKYAEHRAVGDLLGRRVADLSRTILERLGIEE